jgi:hypothetical protein
MTGWVNTTDRKALLWVGPRQKGSRSVLHVVVPHDGGGLHIRTGILGPGAGSSAEAAIAALGPAISLPCSEAGPLWDVLDHDHLSEPARS